MALGNNNDVYFAAYEYGDPRYLDALLDKVNIYRRFCESSGRLSRWQRSLQNYFGVSSDGTKSSSTVTRGGDQGQLTMAKVNDYRNLVQHQLILITSQRPAGEAKAINSDPTSLKQARIGSSLIEYYLSQVGYEQRFVRCAETFLIADESFFVIDWDATAGEIVRPEVDEMGQPTGKNQMTGDLVARIISPWNMARDPYLGTPDDMKWGIYSWRTNKYDLASKYPDFSDDILKGNSKKLKELVFNTINEKDTDQTEIFCMVHAPTPSVPNGRITLFTSETVLPGDGDFPYNEFNIYRASQNDSTDSCFGYSNNNDLLALEEVTDALHSVLISNNTAFGAQAIIGPKGANIDHTQLGKGFAYFEVDPAHIDKIKPLQLTKSAPETYKYLDTLGTKKETIAGINSVVRGDPEGALRSNSGSALALVQAQSLQYQSGGQRSYYQLLSRACTGMILMLQKFADSERVIRITGKVQGQYLEEFKYSSGDLNKISAVTFEMTNPLEKTIGGKEALAKDLLDKNMIKNANQYLTVVRTGSFDAFTEDDEADELAIKSENERLRDGKPVQVVKTENHKKHIQSHMSIIASPESKDDAQLVQSSLAHIDLHIDWWSWLSVNEPSLLIATNQQVLPMGPGMPQPGGPTPGTPEYKQSLAPAMPPQGPPGPPNGAPPPHQGPTPPPQHPPAPKPGQSMPKMMNPVSPAEATAGNVQQPNMPRPPINPMTNQRVSLPGTVPQ